MRMVVCVPCPRVGPGFGNVMISFWTLAVSGWAVKLLVGMQPSFWRTKSFVVCRLVSYKAIFKLPGLRTQDQNRHMVQSEL